MELDLRTLAFMQCSVGNFNFFNPMKKSFYSIFLFLPFLLDALPPTRDVVTGEVSFAEIEQQLKITASDGAVISYPNGFDIGSGETVQFIQPSSSARVLNQIYGESPSQINGNLQANGHVYLLHSAGIIFGKNSVVEVGKLSAIAGTLSSQDFSAEIENFTGLSGAVQNSGIIVAQEVVLAGSSVTNSGTILAENGTLVMAAGEGLSLYTEDSTLSVVLSGDEEAHPGMPYPGMLSDVAGQALLQSGVVEASKGEFHGKEITVSGKTQTTDLSLGNFDSISGGEGTILTNRLVLNVPFQSETSPSIDISSKDNQISQILASGNFQSLKVRSSGELSVGDSTEPLNFTSQILDIRVANGGLHMNSLPTPISANLENSILLASEGALTTSFDIGQLNYQRMLLYGTNLTALNFEKIETKPENLYQLNATTIVLDDLSLDFSSSVIQKLSTENPSFQGFSLQGSASLEASSSESQVNSESVSALPSVTSFASPSFDSFDLVGNIPNFSPVSLSNPYETATNSVSATILELAESYSLFENFSYYLKAPDTSERLANLFASSGGSSALFGGSYNVLSSDSSSQQSESGSKSDSGSTSEKRADQSNASSKIKGAVPFAPIALPLSSPEAGLILDSSLSPEIESSLNKYLD